MLFIVKIDSTFINLKIILYKDNNKKICTFVQII